MEILADQSGESVRQHSLIAAMLEPSFYPRPPLAVTHQETHISHLFFAGELVYKIKKPIGFTFLDYSTLARRHQCLLDELRLNRRLAPSVYLGVVPLTLDEAGWHLGGVSEPVEYALVMHRLPAKRMLRFLLGTGQVSGEMIGALADLLANFHQQAERCRGLDPDDYLAAMQRQWGENFTDIEDYLGPADRQGCAVLKACGGAFFAANAEVLKQRLRAGWVREVHGDLHSEHICYAPEGIQVFDGIEFSAALRRIDLVTEIAFLTMDLTVHGGGALRAPFLARYGELIPDPDRSRLLPFFESYRALVRAKVHVLRRGGWNDAAARYFNFAQRLTWSGAQPFVIMLCGFTGSGKSTLARALSERLGVAIINSDTVRKQIAGKVAPGIVPLNEDIYSPTMTEKTYNKLARQTEKRVAAGEGVIVDAGFGRRAMREKLIRVAERCKIPLVVVHCSAPEAIVAARLRQRAAQGTDISDGRWEVYLAQKASFEPIDELPAASVWVLDTSPPVEDLVAGCEPFLRSRLRANGSIFV